MSNREILHDAAGAARFLTLRTPTLAKWRTLGKGPKFIRLGGAIRYRESDLRAFIEERVVGSTAEADARGASK